MAGARLLAVTLDVGELLLLKNFLSFPNQKELIFTMDMSLSKLRLGNSEGQGILACCISWGPKESDTT